MKKQIQNIYDQYPILKDCKEFDSKTFHKQFCSEQRVVLRPKTKPFLFWPEDAKFHINFEIAKCSPHSEI